MGAAGHDLQRSGVAHTLTVVPVLAGVTGAFVPDDVGRTFSVLAMGTFGGGSILLGIGAVRGRRSVAASVRSSGAA